MPFDQAPPEVADVAAPVVAESAGARRRLAGLAAAAALGVGVGVLVPAPLAGADPDLARLMGAMAALKAVIAAALIAAIAWRFKTAASRSEIALYVATATAMTVGVVLMARMASPVAAAIVLHAGLFGAIVLLLRDRTIATRMATEIERRRARRRADSSRSV